MPEVAKLVPVRHGTVESIVGRLHVSMTRLAVVREVKTRLKPGFWETYTPHQRRYFIAAVLNAHAVNRQCYEDVMHRRNIELEWCFLFDPAGATPKEQVIA
jgi:hypothetical protein